MCIWGHMLLVILRLSTLEICLWCLLYRESRENKVGREILFLARKVLADRALVDRVSCSLIGLCLIDTVMNLNLIPVCECNVMH